MNIPTNIQIIKQNGAPAFAVIPYDEFLKAFPGQGDDTIPHEVVGLVNKKGYNLIKAWRLHLGLTQRQVSARAEISQAALSQMERSAQPNRTATLEKLAAAMNLSLEQIRE